MQKQPKKILVIRSATRILDQTLASLQEEFSGCHITVLVPQSVKESMEKNEKVNAVLAIPDQRRITVSSYGMENIRKLREMNFDLAVSLYNIDHGLGYSNIDLLALESKAKSVRGYNSRGTFSEVTRSTATKKAFMEKTTMFWVGINYFATSILFVIITLALIGEWLMRLPVKKKHTPAPVPSPSVREAVKVQV
jgi:ADP-heptose:LPS heptosyltransferase